MNGEKHTKEEFEALIDRKNIKSTRVGNLVFAYFRAPYSRLPMYHYYEVEGELEAYQKVQEDAVRKWINIKESLYNPREIAWGEALESAVSDLSNSKKSPSRSRGRRAGLLWWDGCIFYSYKKRVIKQWQRDAKKCLVTNNLKEWLILEGLTMNDIIKAGK